MKFEVICFDCDSTLSKIEGIDELAKWAGLGDAIANLTNAAMNGEIPLQSIYGQRLSLIRPDQTRMAELAECYITEMVEGAKEVFAQIQAQGKNVHIISGGLRQAILPLAQALGVHESHVHAVDVFFDVNGHYSHYDETSPLAKTGGKATVAGQLTKHGKLAMIGDGITDMEAKQAGAYTIGFGGVVQRSIVREMADIYIDSANLTAVLNYL